MQTLTENVDVREQGETYADKIIEALKHSFAADIVIAIESVIHRAVQNGMKQFEERLQKTLTALQLDSLKSLSDTASNLEHVLLYVENYVMQIFRDLLIRDPPVLSPSILLCDDPLKVLPSKPVKTKGDIYRETFQAKHDDLMDNLDPEGSGLVDHLVERSLLTGSDEESIATSCSRREKTRKILSVASSAPPEKIEVDFLAALETTHPEQADQFRERFKEIEQRPPSPTCLPCRIRNEVDLGRISSCMSTQKKISKAEREDLCNTSISNEKKWKIVMKTPKKQEAVIEALRYKYKEFYDRCKSLGITSLDCQCPVLDVKTERRLSAPELTDDTWWSIIRDVAGSTQPQLQKSASISSIANVSAFSSLPSGKERITFTYMHSSASSLANMSDFSSIGSEIPIFDIPAFAFTEDLSCTLKRQRNSESGHTAASETVARPPDSDTSEEEVKPQKKKGYLETGV